MFLFCLKSLIKRKTEERFVVKAHCSINFCLFYAHSRLDLLSLRFESIAAVVVDWFCDLIICGLWRIVLVATVSLFLGWIELTLFFKPLERAPSSTIKP